MADQASARAPEMEADADPRLLETVIANLLGNAWKYSQPRDHARIECGCVEGDGETTFFVRDNGMGIDPSQQEKVFELFYKVNRRL